MTTAPIPASLATACAAHDRHRLDVLDALLDEAAPSAVRELLGAALDLCATLRADRDALAAKLDAAPKVCAIHGVNLAVEADAFNRIDTERADAMSELARACRDLASERAHLAACRTRIAGLEQAADERSAEVARLTARVAELEARPVLTVERLMVALNAHGHAGLARKVFAHLGPVTLLPAQDRAKELAAAFMNERAARGKFMTWAELTDGDRAKMTDAARAALASLGAPATTPTAAPDRSLVLTAASLLRDIVRNEGLAQGGEVGPRASDCMDMVRRLESTPTAAPGLVAAVSVEELIGLYGSAYNECSCSDGRFNDPSCCNKAAIRAVLARLNATTIAPVDPEAVARAYHASEALPDVPSWTEVSSFGRHYAIAAMRATLTAHGIPVTPEVGK